MERSHSDVCVLWRQLSLQQQSPQFLRAGDWEGTDEVLTHVRSGFAVLRNQAGENRQPLIKEPLCVTICQHQDLKKRKIEKKKKKKKVITVIMTTIRWDGGSLIQNLWPKGLHMLSWLVITHNKVQGRAIMVTVSSMVHFYSLCLYLGPLFPWGVQQAMGKVARMGRDDPDLSLVTFAPSTHQHKKIKNHTPSTTITILHPCVAQSLTR